MPRNPKGHKRPADVISNAVAVMRIATGEADESANLFKPLVTARAAKGGAARAAKLTAGARKEIATAAAAARWQGRRRT